MLKAELAGIPASSGRFAETQQLLASLDDRIKNAEKEEAKAKEETESPWSYRERPDKMGRGTEKFATVESLNLIELAFPYAGMQRVRLQLQNLPKAGKQSLIYIEKGQFSCFREYCDVAIRFDEGKVQTFKAEKGAPSATGDFLFFMDYDYNRLVTALRKAKKVSMEVEIYREGTHVLSFNVAGLRW